MRTKVTLNFWKNRPVNPTFEYLEVVEIFAQKTWRSQPKPGDFKISQKNWIERYLEFGDYSDFITWGLMFSIYKHTYSTYSTCWKQLILKKD